MRGLAAHEHTGRLRPHRHTSYAGLAFALLLTGVLLLGVSWAAQAAPPAVNPQSGSVGLSGVVRGPAPKTSATIATPPNGSHTSASPISVSGTCPVNTYVSITKNNVFGGVTDCQDDGTFQLLVDLFDGSNTLVARVSDTLGQYGPDSSPVTVFYDSPDLGAPGGATGKQLFLKTSVTVAGTNPQQLLKRTLEIVGGVPPYAASFDWGDGQQTLVSAASPGEISGSHAYDRAGTYQVIVRVTDVNGNAAYLQVVTVVNGAVEQTGATHGNGLGALPGSLLTAWPLYLMALLMVVFFWLGERRELHKLRNRGLTQA